MREDARTGRNQPGTRGRSRSLTRPTRRGLLRGVGLGWSVLCLTGGVLIVVPDANPRLYIVGVLLTEFSLVLTMAAGLGLVFAALTASAGARVVAGVAAAASVTALVASLIPVGDGLQTASEQGVTLSLAGYLPRPATGAPSHTLTFHGTGGSPGERRLDVWPAADPSDAQGRRDPAVVLVHGGGWDSGSRGGSHLAGWLADRGYVVFDTDYRLATPTSPSWPQAPGDVKCAVGWVRHRAARFGVDPRRIGLLGSSAGGHLALLAALSTAEPRLPPTCHPDQAAVSAVAALYPVTDLTAYYDTPTRWLDWSLDVQGLTARFVGGTPTTVPDRYRLASPVTHVDHGDPPTFLAHGTHDQVVPTSQSTRLAQRLRQADVPHRLVLLRGSNHGYDLFGGGWNTQTTLATLDGFLDRWLGTTRG
jgi:acetyl esterase/lipase